MRTSFCIIMAAVLSLCLFGAGSAGQDPSETQFSDAPDTALTDGADTVTQTDSPENNKNSESTPVRYELPESEVEHADAVTTLVCTEAPEAEVPETEAEAPEALPAVTPTLNAPTLLSGRASRRSAAEVSGSLTDDSTVTVYDHDTGDYTAMPLREYLIGVVAAEMPMSFHTEAFKAQAIAARTYAIYKLCRGGASDHPKAAICNETSHCCAFVPIKDAAEKWGHYAEQVIEIAEKAVDYTRNTVVIYEDACICAAWHSSSSGFTKNASDVWGGQVAYLCSVPTCEDRGVSGHGVGMSQYGAEAMAIEGATAEEILTHYYTDATVAYVE